MSKILGSRHGCSLEPLTSVLQVINIIFSYRRDFLPALCVCVCVFVWEMGLSDIITVCLLQCIRGPLCKACLLYVLWIPLWLLQVYMYQKLCYCEKKKNIFDNIEIQISISQQRASITSTALVLTMQLQQLSAVGGIYKINSIHLLMQKRCNDNTSFSH